ncbi:MAG: solute-binding protein [Leptolyngbya sp. RL_3_1]|nr:solute-binding protein [Leptolyngbya sp. RL_3_1]
MPPAARPLAGKDGLHPRLSVANPRILQYPGRRFHGYSEELPDMVQNRSLFVLLMLAAMTLPPSRQAISAVSLAQAPDATAPAGIDPFATEPPAAAPPAASPAPTEASPAPLPPAFVLPESLPPDTILTIDGSVSMAAINRTLIRRFEQRFPGVTVVVKEQGSTAALQALLAGDGPDLAAIGRPLSAEELAQG